MSVVVWRRWCHSSQLYTRIPGQWSAQS